MNKTDKKKLDKMNYSFVLNLLHLNHQSSVTMTKPISREFIKDSITMDTQEDSLKNL